MATTTMNRFSGFVAAAAGLALAASAPAAAIVWDGSAGTDFTDGANWVGNTAPANSDYKDVATFMENSPANKTPTLPGSYSLGGLNFDNSTGWTLAGSGTTILRSVSSTGVGTNTVTQKLKTYQTIDPNVWTIGSGNVLEANGGVDIDGSSKSLKITGGGTLTLPGPFDGYSSGITVHIADGTVRLGSGNISSKGGSNGYVYIDSTTSYFQLKTTVAAAQAKIDNAPNKGSIIDGTGFGLTVTDIGGGYVQIAAVPEPATVGLLAIGGLTLLARRRRA